MERSSLQQIADLLGTLESGKWLQRQLAEFASPSLYPHILVLVSAPRFLQQLFPAEPQNDPSWQIWPEYEELTIPVLERSDLIIWLMPAMRLFPGEYALALEQARQQSIPIWAIITGIERLSDENSFLHQRLPKYRASLPLGSQFFLARPALHTPLQETITQSLDKEAAHILKQGDERRLRILTIQLKERLNQERQAISRRLNKAEQFASTAEAGVSSLKILTSATTTTILAEYYSLQQTIETLRNTLLEKAAIEGIHEPLDALFDIFVGTVSTWQLETFEPALQEKSVRVQAYIQKWYEDYTQEISEFFQFSRSLSDSTSWPSLPLAREKFDLYLENVRKMIFQSLERFSRSFRYSMQHITSIASETSETASIEEEDFSKEAFSKNESSSYQREYQQDQLANRSISLRRRLRRLIDDGRRMLNEWSDPIYDYERQRKEVFQEVIHQHIQWFTDDLVSVIRQQQKPLNTLLEGIQNAVGDQQLEQIQSTLATPQAQLALIAAAERLLRGNA